MFLEHSILNEFTLMFAGVRVAAVHHSAGVDHNGVHQLVRGQHKRIYITTFNVEEPHTAEESSSPIDASTNEILLTSFHRESSRCD